MLNNPVVRIRELGVLEIKQDYNGQIDTFSSTCDLERLSMDPCMGKAVFL